MRRRADILLTALRLIPPGTRGKRRLATRLLRRRLRGNGPAEIATPWGLFDVPSLREPVAQALLIDGVYEPDVLHVLRTISRAGDVIVDVGANIGCFTIPLAQHVGTTGRVLAIEASPAVVPYLARNVSRAELSQVMIIAAAATSHDGGTVPFHVAPDAKFGMGTLSPIFADARVTVPARSLDGVLVEHGVDEVAVIKVDVEGHEADVFQGAERLLASRRPPVLVFEFLDWAEHHATGRPGEAQRILMALGFTLWRLEQYPAIPYHMPITTGEATIVARRQDADVRLP